MDRDEGFRDPNEGESALLKKLLDRSFPGQLNLSRQLEGVSVRWEKASRMLIRVPEQFEPAEVKKSVPLEAEGVALDSDGMVIHLLIHVRDGFLKELELYREDGGEIMRLPSASDVRPAYP